VQRTAIMESPSLPCGLQQRKLYRSMQNRPKFLKPRYIHASVRLYQFLVAIHMCSGTQTKTQSVGKLFAAFDLQWFFTLPQDFSRWLDPSRGLYEYFCAVDQWLGFGFFVIKFEQKHVLLQKWAAICVAHN